MTVLEMTEPVSTVAVGSPVFKVEWRENKVFIEPTEVSVATICLCGRRRAVSITSSTPREPSRKWISRLTSQWADPPKISASAKRAGEPG